MTTLSTKLAGSFMALALVLGMVPASVFAAASADTATETSTENTPTTVAPQGLSDTDGVAYLANSTPEQGATASVIDGSATNTPATDLIGTDTFAVAPSMNAIVPGPLTPTPTTVTVTPSSSQGWATYGLAAGGNVTFVHDANAPTGTGALDLTTANDVNSVTHYQKTLDVALSNVTKFSYDTKQVAAIDQTNGNATLRISIDLDGDGQEDDQLMYEPYFNGYMGGMNYNTWTITQATGELWSNYGLTYNGKGGENPGYDTNFTLSDVLEENSNAQVLSIILSMGTYNAGQDVHVDDVRVVTTASDTTYNFETDPAAPKGVVTVTPSNLQGFGVYTDVELNGTATSTATSTFVADSTSPRPNGALQLSTPAESDEILYDRTDSTMTPVEDIDISYASRRLSGAPYAAPAYILGIDIDGNAATTEDVFYAWYEPVYNGGSNYDSWNTWTLNQSSKFYSPTPVGTKGGVRGGNFFTLQDVNAVYPQAAVNEYSIDLGSGSPGFSVLVDDVVTPTAIYDFEQDTTSTTGTSSGGSSRHRSRSGSGSTTTSTTTTTTTTGGQSTTTTTDGQVLGASIFNFTRDLFFGLRGADVMELQTLLIAAGYSIPAGPTGFFGPQTRAAVAQWQAENSITPAAGYFGPISRAKYAADGGFHLMTTPVATTTTTTTGI